MMKESNTASYGGLIRHDQFRSTLAMPHLNSVGDETNGIGILIKRRRRITVSKYDAYLIGYRAPSPLLQALKDPVLSAVVLQMVLLHRCAGVTRGLVRRPPPPVFAYFPCSGESDVQCGLLPEDRLTFVDIGTT